MLYGIMRRLPCPSGSQAIDDLYIEFFGKASHAAFDPWQGRSALDTLKTVAYSINLLRKHVAGAAMATETTSKIENLGSYNEMLINLNCKKKPRL